MTNRITNKISLAVFSVLMPVIARADAITSINGSGTNIISEVMNLLWTWWGMGIAALVIGYFGLMVAIGYHSLQLFFRILLGMAIIYGVSGAIA